MALFSLLGSCSTSGSRLVPLRDADPTQQRQAAGQAIGQSAHDSWNRADADATGAVLGRPTPNPYVNHLIDYPDAPGRSSAQLQLLPSTSDFDNDDAQGSAQRHLPGDDRSAGRRPVVAKRYLPLEALPLSISIYRNRSVGRAGVAAGLTDRPGASG